MKNKTYTNSLRDLFQIKVVHVSIHMKLFQIRQQYNQWIPTCYFGWSFMSRAHDGRLFYFEKMGNF